MKRSLWLGFSLIIACTPRAENLGPAVPPGSIDLAPAPEAPNLVEVLVSQQPGPTENTTEGPAKSQVKEAALAKPPGELSAKACEIVGRKLTPSPFLGGSQRTLAFDPKGGLYLGDDQSVVRFNVTDKNGSCVLELDRSFGRGGAVALDYQVYRLSVAADGRVLACGWSACSVIDQGKAIPACDAPFGRRKRVAEEPEDQRKEGGRESHGMLALTDPGQVGGGVVRMRTLMGVELTDEGCKVDAYGIGDDFAISGLARFGDTFYVAGRNAMGESKLYIHDIKEGRKGEILSEEPPSERALCWVSQIVTCGEGLCLLDTQCRRITVIDRQGSFFATHPVSRLLGDGELQPTAIAYAGPHQHFLLAQTRGPRGFEGRVFKVQNLTQKQ